MKDKKLRYHPDQGFKVPENYFQDFEERMMLIIKEERCLEDSYKGDSGFTVPQDYMNSLEDQILSKVENKKPRGKLISLFNNPKNYYAAAVAAVFIGIISTLLFDPVSPEFSFDSIELTIMENYIDEGNIDLNYHEISNIIIEGNYSLDFNTIGISDEEVFNYLDQSMENKTLLYK